MVEITCRTCGTLFKGRPNRRYCSSLCRRAAEREVKGDREVERFSEFLNSLPPAQKAFFDNLPVVDFNDCLTPEQRENLKKSGWI